MTKDEAMRILGGIINEATGEGRTMAEIADMVAIGMEKYDEDLIALAGGLEITMTSAGRALFVVGGRTIQ